MAPWPGGQGGGPWLPLLIVETRRKIVNVVGNCRKIVNVVRNCQSCRREGGGGGGVSEDLKCCPEKFLVCRKKISVCRKSTALAPPQKKTPKKHGSHGATAYLIILLFLRVHFYCRLESLSYTKQPLNY